MTADADIGRSHVEASLRGWKDIADYIEVSVDAAQERAKLLRDPLPVFRDHRGVFAYVSGLREWVARTKMAIQIWDQMSDRKRAPNIRRVRRGKVAVTAQKDSGKIYP